MREPDHRANTSVSTNVGNIRVFFEARAACATPGFAYPGLRMEVTH